MDTTVQTFQDKFRFKNVIENRKNMILIKDVKDHSKTAYKILSTQPIV